MRPGEFEPADIEPYIEQKLPGFKPSLIREPSTDNYTLRVRGHLPFASFETLGQDAFFPLRSYELQRQIDEFVRTTRENAIKMLGLQEQIDAEVKRQIDRERKDIETKAFKNAYEAALKQVAETFAPTASIQALLDLVSGPTHG